MVGAVGGSVLSSLHAARAATDSRQQVERVAGCISLSVMPGGVAIGRTSPSRADVGAGTPARAAGASDPNAIASGARKSARAGMRPP